MKVESQSHTPIRVIILSDRLIEHANKLSDYLLSTGIQVITMATSREQALMFLDERIDFIIIVGYLKDHKNYEIVSDCIIRRLPTIAIQWAMLDALIISYCSIYKIPLRFERTLPLYDFVLFLQWNRPTHTAFLNEEAL